MPIHEESENPEEGFEQKFKIKKEHISKVEFKKTVSIFKNNGPYTNLVQKEKTVNLHLPTDTLKMKPPAHPPVHLVSIIWIIT